MSAAATAAFLVPAAAQADFTLAPCAGSSVSAAGSTLQNTVQQTLWTPAFSTDSSGTCAGVSVTYNGSGALTGSGAGRNAIGASDGTRSSSTLNPTGSRFVGSDEPPTPTEQAKINAGSTSTSADDATIHVIPVAATAIAIDVRLPSQCQLAGIPAGDLDSSGRLKIPNVTLVKAFANQTGGNTWGDLIPGYSYTSGSFTTAGCTSLPVVRVVRFDNSGSSFALKSYLNKITPGTFDTANNTAWPNQGDRYSIGGVTGCPTGHSICDGGSAATGGGNLTKIVAATNGGTGLADGAIGYAALSDSRSNGFDFSGSLSTDSTFWLSLQNVAGTGYFEPTSDANGWKSSAATGGAGNKGANCNGINPGNIPTGADPTTGDWTPVDATGGSGYPDCTLTYDLAFDDNAPVWGTTDAEQAKARTVKDYLTYVVGSVGQSKLGNNVSDYSPLSSNLASISQNGVAAIGWNKAQGSGGGTPTRTTPVTPPVTNPVVPPVTNPVKPPVSNVFSITSAKVKTTTVTLGLTVAGPGKLAVKATSKIKGKTVTFATAAATVAGGKGTVVLKAGSKAKSALKKVKTAKVTVTVTYTPTGGAAATKTQTVTVKGTLKPAKKKTTKKKSSKK